jgi:hypothetical protein
VPGYDREIDCTTISNLTHTASPATLDHTGQELRPRRIAEGFEQIGIERAIDGRPLALRQSRILGRLGRDR